MNKLKILLLSAIFALTSMLCVPAYGGWGTGWRKPFGTDTVTMSSEAVGHGTRTPTANRERESYYVITDNTGGVEDHFDLKDATRIGKRVTITLFTDAETSGLLIIPTNKMIGTSTLLEDAGDSITYEWTGTHYNVVSNIGGTEL